MQRQTLIIKLDSDLYGIDVRLIQEVIKNYNLREIPDAPNFIEGVISLRESIIPLIKIKRILNMPMFDLYKHKKVIILNFGEGIKIGIVVDDVLGIHYYDDKDVQSIDTVSRSYVVQYVLGVIKKDEHKVALLDVFSMFFSNKGDFLYKQYFKKEDKIQQTISKKEYFLLQEKVTKNNFPFNAITKEGIIKYVAKIASMQGISIEEALKDNSIFKNSHFDLEQKRTYFFENKADMYVISELMEKFLKEKKKIKVWVLGNALGEDAYSISCLFESFDLPFKEITIINSDSHLENLIKGKQGIYPKEALYYIPPDLQPLFFDISGENYQVNSKIKSRVIFDFFKPNEKFQPENMDIIYAPNYFAKNSEKVDILLKNIYKALNPNGILMLGLFENIEGFAKKLKKYYIKNRLVFIKET